MFGLLQKINLVVVSETVKSPAKFLLFSLPSEKKASATLASILMRREPSMNGIWTGGNVQSAALSRGNATWPLLGFDR